MAKIVSQFFGVIGVDMVPPATLAELIPYLLQIVVGVALVSGTFHLIGQIAVALFNFRRW